MNITFRKAIKSDINKIYEMQQKAFLPLLKKYQDYGINPACETVERVTWKFNQAGSSYYIADCDGTDVGAIRILAKPEFRYKVSPVFVIPEFQGRGIAQMIFHFVEEIHSDAVVWELDTILEEAGNCYLYEKLGYVKTGALKSISDSQTLVFYEKWCKK